MSYYAIDADIASGAATASSVKVRDKSIISIPIYQVTSCLSFLVHHPQKSKNF